MINLNKDIIKFIFDNKDKFEIAKGSDTILSYHKDDDSTLHLVKGNSLYAIYIYHKMETIYDYVIYNYDKNYQMIDSLYTNKYDELNKLVEKNRKEKLVIKFLGKNTRYFKIKKLKGLL